MSTLSQVSGAHASAPIIELLPPGAAAPLAAAPFDIAPFAADPLAIIPFAEDPAAAAPLTAAPLAPAPLAAAAPLFVMPPFVAAVLVELLVSPAPPAAFAVPLAPPLGADPDIPPIPAASVGSSLDVTQRPWILVLPDGQTFVQANATDPTTIAINGTIEARLTIMQSPKT